MVLFTYDLGYANDGISSVSKGVGMDCNRIACLDKANRITCIHPCNAANGFGQHKTIGIVGEICFHSDIGIRNRRQMITEQLVVFTVFEQEIIGVAFDINIGGARCTNGFIVDPHPLAKDL